MANKKFKGRKAGVINYTTIKDPILEPFFITKDQYGYTVNEKVETSNMSNDLKSSKSKPVGYYQNFDMALREIATGRLNAKNKSYDLQEYINEWRNITNEIADKFKI